MEIGYSKRIFTAKSFFTDLGFLIRKTPQLIRMFRNKNIEALISKILIVVDAVNKCTYCTWMDAKLALRNGLSDEEVKNILKLEFKTSVSDDELPALVFAQDIAKNGGEVDPDALETITASYGEATAKDIILAIRAVTFGNMYFNTWGAFPSRLKGNPAPNSNPIFEAIYYICNFIIVVPFIILKKLNRNAIRQDMGK